MEEESQAQSSRAKGDGEPSDEASEASRSESGDAPGGQATQTSSGDDLDAEGRERPPFLRGFPDDPELGRLVAAFERGNYREVNEKAPALIKATKSKKVRRAARELVERTRPDPMMKYLLAISVLLLLYFVIFAYSHAH